MKLFDAWPCQQAARAGGEWFDFSATPGMCSAKEAPRGPDMLFVKSAVWRLCAGRPSCEIDPEVRVCSTFSQADTWTHCSYEQTV